jgi:hypothetical protein
MAAPVVLVVLSALGLHRVIRIWTDRDASPPDARTQRRLARSRAALASCCAGGGATK